MMTTQQACGVLREALRGRYDEREITAMTRIIFDEVLQIVSAHHEAFYRFIADVVTSFHFPAYLNLL